MKNRSAIVNRIKKIKLKSTYTNKFSIAFVVIFAVAGSYMLFSTKAADTFPKTRNVYKWPFSKTSIWNMPIGSNAKYVPSDLQTTSAWYNRVTIDEENIGQNPDDPLKILTVTGGSKEGSGAEVRVPADMTADGRWNNCSTFIMKDKTKIIQGQPLTLSKGGNPSWTWTIGGIIDLKSDGYFGCHGGSRLSGIGGSLREGELTSAEPIRHALKINVFCKRFCSQTTNGFRWPAVVADSGYTNPSAENYYGGSNPAVKMGSLLAIKPGTDLSFITSTKLKKIAKAFTDYGAYVVDNTAWDVYGIAADKRVKDTLLNTDIAGDTESKEYHRQFQKLITSLMVVDNNSASSIGGGGTPRVPLAPCFDDEPTCADDATPPTPSPEPTPTPSPEPQGAYITIDESFTNGVSMTASTTSGSFGPEKARDGNEKDDQSRWISQSADSQTLVLDLGASKPINKVAYLFAGDTTKNYKIEASIDGQSYIEVASSETDNQKFTFKEHSFDTINARYVRLTGLTRWNNNYGHSVREMGVYISETPPAPPVPGSIIRINTGGGEYIDSAGNKWIADANFDAGSGSTYEVSNEISGTNNDKLYQSERWCPGSYAIPAVNGTYKLNLHFAEINPRSGTRIFGMSAEGKPLFTNYNISAVVGDFTADVKQYDVSISDGKLDLTFEKNNGCPKISAIELLTPEAAVHDTTPPTVNITNPANDAIISGTTELSAEASDDKGVSGVVFVIDGKTIINDTSKPYETQLDTTTFTNGIYTVEAIAKDTSGNQSRSSILITINNTATDTTAPSTPGNLQITENTYSAVTMKWVASTDDTAVQEYIVYRNGLPYASTSNTQYRDTNVKGSTSYKYEVSAKDAYGNESSRSNEVNITTPAPADTTPPSSPSNLVATNIESNSISLKWNAATDNVGVVGYYVYKDGAVIGNVSGTSFIASNLAAATAHVFSVRAYDAASNVGEQVSATFTTAAAPENDTQAPSTPTNLSAAAVKNSQVNLKWSPSTDNSGFVEYYVYRNGSLIMITTSISFGDARVNPNTHYTYTVRAVDKSANYSGPSNSASLIPKRDR